MHFAFLPTHNPALSRRPYQPANTTCGDGATEGSPLLGGTQLSSSQASNPKKILLATTREREICASSRQYSHPPLIIIHHAAHKRTVNTSLGTYSVATTPFLQTSKWRISRRGCSVERSRDTADRSCAWRTPRGAIPPIPRPTTTTTTTTRAAAADAAVVFAAAVIIIVRASSSAVPRTGPHGCGTCERGARRCA